MNNSNVNFPTNNPDNFSNRILHGNPYFNAFLNQNLRNSNSNYNSTLSLNPSKYQIISSLFPIYSMNNFQEANHRNENYQFQGIKQNRLFPDPPKIDNPFSTSIFMGSNQNNNNNINVMGNRYGYSNVNPNAFLLGLSNQNEFSANFSQNGIIIQEFKVIIPTIVFLFQKLIMFHYFQIQVQMKLRLNQKTSQNDRKVQKT